MGLVRRVSGYDKSSESENAVIRILGKQIYRDGVQKFSYLRGKLSTNVIGEIEDAEVMLSFVKTGLLCWYGDASLRSCN